jgi:hypothetical protein
LNLSSLKNAQRAWAVRTGRTVDAAGYVPDLSANTIVPLCEESLREFALGSGGELNAGRRGAPPKLLATHSSAALACNAFEYWRPQQYWRIVELALALPSRIVSFQYEAHFPTGLEGKPPNLDVLLALFDGSVCAIESKFTEPFRSRSSFAALKEKYFPNQQPIWTERGLPACGELAMALRSGEISFRRLDATQLLKHALGLKASGRPFALAYMWLDMDTAGADEHREDIERFSRCVGSELAFRAISYQQFLKELRLYAGTCHDRFFDYFEDRYGCDGR